MTDGANDGPTYFSIEESQRLIQAGRNLMDAYNAQHSGFGAVNGQLVTFKDKSAFTFVLKNSDRHLLVSITGPVNS